MMTAMMAPTVWPWVVAFDRLNSPRQARWCPPLGGWTGVAVFCSGYAAAWLLYSLAAATIQVFLPHELPPSFAATILFTAGAFQFAPLKRACLRHCRNPLSYFLVHWREGSSGSFAMGLHHGLFCVACCWALMATTLAVGVMSLWWMSALALMTFAEQVTPWGDRARTGIGIALMMGASWQLALGTLAP